ASAARIPIRKSSRTASAASRSACCIACASGRRTSGAITPGRRETGWSWRFTSIGWSPRDAFLCRPPVKGEATPRLRVGENGMNHDHDHDKEHDEGPPSEYEIMSRAMQELLIEKGVISAEQ